MKHIKTFEFINESINEAFKFNERQVKDVADKIAQAIAKMDNKKTEVHDMEFDKGRGAGFEISIDGEKYDGGSYTVQDNGDVVNSAIGNSFPNAVYAKIGDTDIKKIIKNIKMYESVVTEAKRRLSFKDADITSTMDLSTAIDALSVADISWDQKGQSFTFDSPEDLETAREVLQLDESIVTEKREDVGKYNTVKKVISKLGRRPSEQDLATFINNNYYDVTEVERGDNDERADDKIADLVGFYKFDIDDWEIAWADAQNESVVTEGSVIDLRLVNENVEDEIESALTNWLNTLADGNAVAITDLYLENGVLLGTVAKDIKQGHAEIQEYFEMFLKKSPIGSVDSFILQNFGNICISDGTYTFEVDSKSGNRESVSARYTYVWKKENKKWMIATHHSSINPE